MKKAIILGLSAALVSFSAVAAQPTQPARQAAPAEQAAAEQRANPAQQQAAEHGSEGKEMHKEGEMKKEEMKKEEKKAH